ncbi:MAG: PAS domain S-box protein [Curvibacter sp. PD_MW3]|nr:MAG: PAS domain S-box protein [Curvibacter sp. PD_MW3]
MSDQGLIKQDAFFSEGRIPSFPAILRLLAPAVLIAGISVAAGQVHYLLFHALAEVFSIVIALTALVVASTSRRFTRNHFTVYVAVAIGWCAALDMIHTVSYKGMNLLPQADANMPTQFWIAARFLQALALLSSPLFLRRAIRIDALQLGCGLVALGAAVWVFSGHFPVMFVEGQGLTPFKIYAEYVIIALLGATGVLYWRDRRLMSSSLFLSMQLALVAMILSEFAFTRYANVYGLSNELGHVFKIFAYWFVYLALVQSTLREPFSMLSRTASTYDAVPDPAIVIHQDGLIHQANQAAAAYAGMKTEELIGQSSHAIFHASAVPAGDCPVCARLASGESRFLVEIDRGGAAGIVECQIAPFLIEDRERSYVQVVRDITDEKQLLAERELLVHDLGERIKELRCQYAISNILEKADIGVPSLLAQVVDVLPAGFLFPEHARAAFVSDWGTFGSQGAEHAKHCLAHDLYVNQRSVGSLKVFYSAEVAQDNDPFLSEERELLRTAALRVGQAIERIQAGVQVKRLTYLYDMLSATNRAIVRCRNSDELLARVFDTLIQQSAFPLLFVAISDAGKMPFRIVHAHGIDAAALEELHAVLADPQSTFGLAFSEETSKGKVYSIGMQTLDSHNRWHDYLRRHEITERAILPIMREGRLFGVMGLYAQGPGAFDQAQLNLLHEMAEDLEFALNSMAQSERRRMAEERAEMSEFRFREVFEASPTPMQIQSLSTGTMRAVNRAHTEWLGYALKDIDTLERWLTLAYTDPVVRESLRKSWLESVAEAKKSGSIIRSPELILHGKDGRERIAIGTMTVVGDDAIVTWEDLTDIRRSEQALRQSEQHFRTMIEQTVMGIFVRRDNRFVYVNPRFCEMAGRSKEELLGHEIWQFTGQDADNIARIRAAWARLQAGERSLHYNVSLLLKSGESRELALHANPVNWDDGQPATIVMAEDVTERKQTEAKLADYVKQLEASMRGTLQAVSNMIDQRDPYTAGHERRVGLIAGAIGREMGWPEERCSRMELVGLVHDIGKISVPAEILTKPGRLTDLEMRLVREHAQIGYEILQDIPFPFPVADIIRQHHERLDGSGYPQGLKGDAILPEAKVLAVADVIESISSHRPYRPARGLDAALDELERGRDTHYDPAVIDAFSRLLHDKGYTLPQ